MRYIVGPAIDIPPGTSTVVYPEKVKSGVGVFNIDGEYYAVKNTCPHMGGPLCKGKVRGTSEADLPENRQPEIRWNREGEIIACPWHHWEFDIKTGKTIFNSKQRVRGYPVSLVSAESLARLREGVETVPVSVEDATVIIDV